MTNYFICLPYGVAPRSFCMDRLELDKFIETEDASKASAIILRLSALDTLARESIEADMSWFKLVLFKTVLIFCASRRGVDILSRVSKISLAVELKPLSSLACAVTLFAEAEANDDDGRE